MAFSGDEDPVGALSADGADPALGEGVHPRGLRCGEHDLDADGGKDRVEGGTELRVTVANQASESVPGLLQITGKTAGQLNHPVPGRMLGNAERVNPACLDLDDERDIQRFSVTVSTWKKSIASRLSAWARRKVRQVSSRRVDGGTLLARRILRMVEAATRWPRRRSSPWMRTTPQVRFSLARRTIRATSSSPIGGRPGGFGCRHRAAISLRCQRNNVPGVTIRWARSAFGSIRASAARTARSGQDRRGLGLFRRSTATSCRNASISASFDADDRANRASQDST